MRWKDLKQGYENRLGQLAALQPHELFGVTANASGDEIKAAYIRLVKAYHPDAAGPFMAKHNEEVLKLINTAYEKLKASK